MELTGDDLERYDWQMPVLGEAGQRALKGATVLVSRVGGVGGAAACGLAAAGVGRLILAHAGTLKLPDLNRQMLMSHAGLGAPRAEQAAERLRAINPSIEVEAVAENVGESNVVALVGRADLVVDAAPLFEERLLLNRESVRQSKPMVDCAMYGMEGQVTTLLPGRSPCLACLYPSVPPAWKRKFPVLGAVAAMIGSLGAVEAVKVLTGLGDPLAGRLLLCDLGSMSFRTVRIDRNPACPVCRNC